VYSASAYSVLISAPGDVRDEDLHAATEAVNRWSNIYGRRMAVAAVPAHWRHHSAAEHGIRPQASLNSQLVDSADIVIALFWHRLGTATGEAESGTAEEIKEAADRGAYVAVFRCLRDYPQQELDQKQLGDLEAFLSALTKNSLMLSYRSGGELATHVDTVLATAISESRTEAEVSARSSGIGGADVWPRVERTGRNTKLRITNSGTEVAKNVRFRLEKENEADGDLPVERSQDNLLEALAPNGDADYLLFLHMGVADQARCVVTWEDSGGEHENAATVRFF